MAGAGVTIGVVEIEGGTSEDVTTTHQKKCPRLSNIQAGGCQRTDDKSGRVSFRQRGIAEGKNKLTI
jgi:hypothetical protein